MSKKNIDKIVTKIFELQGENGCWNYTSPKSKIYPQYEHYMPKYKTTLWALILLADIKHNENEQRIKKPVKTIFDHFYNKNEKIFCLAYDHFPIPCLNGNMMYIYFYFGNKYDEKIDYIINFFNKYQRFDDGNFSTPKDYPYFSNRSCYGKHTCYWGIVKLLKGLSFIPDKYRTENTDILINKCIDFILLHKVCFSSHNEKRFLHQVIDKLTFPNMYNSDFLEILWLLKREKVKDSNLKKAIELLKSRMQPGMKWKLERPVHNLITSIGAKDKINTYVTERAREVLNYYDK